MFLLLSGDLFDGWQARLHPGWRTVQVKMTVSRRMKPALGCIMSDTFMNCSTLLFHVRVQMDDSLHTERPAFFWFSTEIRYRTQKLRSSSAPNPSLSR